jgi:hypothetical protein
LRPEDETGESMMMRRRREREWILPAGLTRLRNISTAAYKANIIFEISLIDGIDFLESFLMHHGTPRKIRAY